MKTVEEIIAQEPVFLEDWSDLREQEVWNDFTGAWEKDADPIDPEAKILFAFYSYANYEGEAFVLFSKHGQLYEVNAGHCSCYGLEGQWEPELVVLDELANRLSINSYRVSSYSSQLSTFLGL